MSSNTHHHPCSPSSLERRAACPASMRMEDAMPEMTSDDAEEGRLMHAAVWDHSLRDSMSEEQRQALGVCDDVIARLTVEHGDIEWLPEKRLSLMSSFEVLTEGTPDAYGKSKAGALFMLEFKFGRAPVASPDQNWQVKACAAMVAQEIAGPLSDALPDVRAFLVQPRLALVQSHTFSDSHHLAIIDDVIAVISRCRQDGLQFRSGPWCRYCRAAVDCSALRLDTQVALSGPVAIEPANAPEIYRKVKLMEKVLDELRARIKAVVTGAGGSVGFPGDGLKIQRTSGRRQVSDIQAAYTAVSRLFTVDEFLSMFCTCSLPKLEEALAQRLRDRGIAKSLATAKVWIAEHIPSNEGTPVDRLAEF